MDSGTISASLAAAVVTEVVFHPLDTLQTLQQTSTNFSYRLPAARYWRGLLTSVSLTAPAFSLYMVTYRQCKRSCTPYLGESSISNYIVSATVAEISSSFIWTPMEVIKGRLQVIESTGRESTLGIIRSIYANEGFKGFFRGYFMGISVFVPYSVMWWVSYEKSKSLLGISHDKASSLEYGTASAIATATACASTNFLKVIKTRQQLAPAAAISNLRPDDKLSLYRVGRNLITEVGFFRAMVKGLHVNLLHALPTSVLGMIIVEAIEPDIASTPADPL